MRTSVSDRRSGISTTAIVAVVVVVIVVAGVGGYLVSRSPSTSTTTSSTTSTTSSSTTTSSESTTSTTSSISSSSSSSSSTTSSSSSSSGTGGALGTAVDAQIATLQKDYNARDVSAIDTFYTKTSVVNWFNYTNGLGGVYMGAGNIQLLYASTLGNAKTFNINFTNIQTKEINPTTINATSVIQATGVSQVVGNMTITADASQQWVLSGSTWSIQKEDWNYTLFNVSNPSDATVFPQWGLSLSGHNPNLADMHVIEWNYAPYVAAALYSGLAAILVAAIWVSRRR